MVGLLGLCTAGAGCQSGPQAAPMAAPVTPTSGATAPSPTDSFAIHSNADHQPRRLWSFFRRSSPDTAAPVATMNVPAAGAPVYMAGGGVPTYTTALVPTYAAGAAVPAGMVAPAYPTAPPAAAPAYRPQAAPQALPLATSGGEPPVIASTPVTTSTPCSVWQPVQHLTSEPLLPGGPDLDMPPTARMSRPAVMPGAVPFRGPVSGMPMTPGSVVASTPSGPAVAAQADPMLPSPRVVPQAGIPGAGLATPPFHGGSPVVVNVPPHGSIVTGPEGIPPMPREFQKQALPDYVVEPPDILLIRASEAISDPLQPIEGQYLIRPDGSINLGVVGTVRVAGLTVAQVKDQIAGLLLARNPHRFKANPADPKDKTDLGTYTIEQIRRELDVDVLAYNSKFYYVITDGGGYGAQVFRFPVTGNETVLDALSQVNGLPPVASKKCIWVARATPDNAPPKILPVDWCGLVKRGSAGTNYQIYPNDRIYVESDPLIRTDTALQKVLSPIQRVLGATLLGATTVNTIKNGSNPGSGGTGTTGR
jgi:polysaccharide export outer membrane protein